MNIRTHRLAVGYRGSALVTGIDLELSPGGIHFLIGRNGSGKSTLMRTMAGLQDPISGDVVLDDHSVFELSLKTRSELIYYLRGRQDLRSRITVAEFLEIGVGSGLRTGRRKKASAERLSRTLDKVGISSLLDADIQQLSDGEFQKMMVALVILRDAQILFLDEPLSHLDPPSQAEVLDLIAELATTRIVLMSSHYLPGLRTHANRVFLIDSAQEIRELKGLANRSDEELLALYA